MNRLPDERFDYSPEEFIKVSLKRDNYRWYPWLYAYKRELFKNEMFPENMKYEDVYLVWRLLLKAQRIGAFPEKIYAYRRNRAGAITTIKSYSSLCDFINVICINIDNVNSMNITDEVKKLLQDNFARNYFSCCILANCLNKSEKQMYINNLKEKSYIMKYAKPYSYKLMTLVADIFGLGFLIKLLELRMKYKNIHESNL
jgi:hypothetical protein